MKFRRIVSLFMVCAILLTAVFTMPVIAEEPNLTIGAMKGWGWISKNKDSFVNVDYVVNDSRTQVADTLVPDYGYAWTGTFDFTSKDGTLTGPAASKDLDAFGLQYTGVFPDPDVDTIMFYVELPDFAKSGATWALGLNSVAIEQNGSITWVNHNYDAEYSYLSITGDSWKTDVIKGGSDATTRYFNGLPSGFKGYIRVNFENFTYRADVDLDSEYEIEHFFLTLNSLGGKCGGLTFGGIMYVPSNDSNSLTMEFGSETFQLSTGEGDATVEPDEPVVPSEGNLKAGTMKGWNWIDKNQSNLTNISYKTDGSISQVADTLVPSYGYAWDGSYVFSSKDGTLTGPAAEKPLEVFRMVWGHVAADTSADEMMFYVELPDFAKAGADWGIGITGFALEQNGVYYWTNLESDTEISYLSVTGKSWQTAYINGGSTEDVRYIKGLPSGFKGYIRIDFDKFSFWESGLDLDAYYELDHLNISMNAIGSECGNLVCGGITYMLANNSQSTVLEVNGETFQLSTGEGGSTVDPDEPDEPDTPASTDDITVTTMKGWDWINKSGFVFSNVERTVDTTQTQVACTKVPSYGYAWTGTYVISSIDGSVTGPVANKEIEKAHLQWAGVPIDPASDTMMFYVELPKYKKSGAEWALGLSAVGITQDGTEYWADMNYDTEYSYLSVTGESWQKATLKGGADETERYFEGLPSGFKGYIRLNFENFTYRTPINLDNAYDFSYLFLNLNSIGGACGDLKFGAIMYVPTNNSDGLNMKIGSDTYVLSTGEGDSYEEDDGDDEPIYIPKDFSIGEMKGWNWINKDGFKLTNVSYEIDTAQEQVACTKVPSYGYAWTGSYVFTSNDGTVTGPVANKPVEEVTLQWASVPINPTYDTMIFYVELPDFEKSGAEWALGLNAIGISQNGTDYWANMNFGAKYSYLSIFGDRWEEGVIKGGENATERYFDGLPSGFRGYICLNFNNFKYHTNPNLNSAYNFHYIYLTLNSVGGECGDALFGGIMYVPDNDGNTTIMRIDTEAYGLTRLVGGDVTLHFNDGTTSDKAYTNNAINDIITLPIPEREGYTFDGWYYEEAFKNYVGESFSVTALDKNFYAKWIDNTIPGDLDGNGVISAVDLVILRKAILEAGDEYNATAADVNGDGEIDVRDLVRLIKSIV